MEIKTIRKQKGLTTTQVAKALGISQGYYSQLESGLRSFDKEQIARLSAIIMTDPAYLRTIAKRTTENSVLSHHWLTTIPINGVPALQAFRRANAHKNFSSLSHLRKSFKTFLLQHLTEEINNELNVNDELVKLIAASL